MTKHLDIKIYGRVTGVGFRWSAKEKADNLGVAGFVRNVDETYVYIEVEGEEKQLDEFAAWCHKGPFWAKVERVEQKAGGVKGSTGFEVKG